MKNNTTWRTLRLIGLGFLVGYLLVVVLRQRQSNQAATSERS